MGKLNTIDEMNMRLGFSIMAQIKDRDMIVNCSGAWMPLSLMYGPLMKISGLSGLRAMGQARKNAYWLQATKAFGKVVRWDNRWIPVSMCQALYVYDEFEKPPSL